MVSKKTWVGIASILGIFVILLYLLRSGLNIWHWYQIGFDLASYDPWYGPIATLGFAIYLSVLIIEDRYLQKDIPLIVWGVGIVGMLVSIVLLYGSIITWWL